MSKILRKQKDLVERLTRRLVACPLDEFHKIQRELFTQREVLQEMQMAVRKKCGECGHPEGFTRTENVHLNKWLCGCSCHRREFAQQQQNK